MISSVSRFLSGVMSFFALLKTLSHSEDVADIVRVSKEDDQGQVYVRQARQMGLRASLSDWLESSISASEDIMRCVKSVKDEVEDPMGDLLIKGLGLLVRITALRCTIFSGNNLPNRRHFSIHR
jgi:hypothetical protein